MDAPAWVDELDLHVGAPEAAMGTHSLDEDRWLCIDDDWLDQRVEARALLRDRRVEVLAPTAQVPAAIELSGMIDRWLRDRRPDLVDDAHAVEADPLAAARARVAEDLCLLHSTDHGWVLESGAVCFPSYWRLRDKVGSPLSAVHEPVPGYTGAMAARVDGFLDRLRSGLGVWRRNWSIHGVADLYVPSPVHGQERGHAPAPAERWLRSERQTLLRLPDTGAVVFTIRTQQAPIAALAARPDRCAAIAAVLRAWTPAQRRYKGGAVDDDLIGWLVQRSEG